jgi:hypothetical protein
MPKAVSVTGPLPEPLVSCATVSFGALPGLPIEKTKPLETMWPSAETTR